MTLCDNLDILEQYFTEEEIDAIWKIIFKKMTYKRRREENAKEKARLRSSKKRTREVKDTRQLFKRAKVFEIL